ncbi:hypothetical protein [Aeromicrobium ginsengisoli]|uniref:hypothetical protein n=1 Tax=Aeromicrobium ginsengisoli TaxID=363867 RepID=UPI001FE7EFE5|nr:hypothetical protein [Aeromicrobium ginsengisoli]
MAADLWPSMRWTALAFAPDEIARDAAVWRRSCGVTRGMPAQFAVGTGEEECLGRLAGARLLEERVEHLDVRHRARFVVLRRTHVDLGADLDGVAFDREAAPGGVDVADAERDHLAPADSGVRENQDDAGCVSGFAGEAIDLSVVEVDAAAHALALGLHALGRVAMMRRSSTASSRMDDRTPKARLTVVADRSAPSAATQFWIVVRLMSLTRTSRQRGSTWTRHPISSAIAGPRTRGGSA